MSMNQVTEYPDQDRVYHFVPGELCVVVTVHPDIATDPYEAIRERLNTEIPAELPAPIGGFIMPDLATLFDRDIGPTDGVWESYRISAREDDDGSVGLFRAPARPNRMRTVFLNHADDSRTSLNFFRMALSPTKEIARLPEYAQLTRELVNVIYRKFLIEETPSGIDGVAFSAVTPNWLSFIAGSGNNSPGTPAMGISSGYGATPTFGQFFFRVGSGASLQQVDLDTLVTSQRNTAPMQPLSGVTVAVLDTCPHKAVVEAAQAFWNNNRLLRAIVDPNNPVMIEDFPSLDADTDFDAMIPFLPDYLGQLAGWYTTLTKLGGANLKSWRADNFGAADHGLFVAGIIKDIAPAAKVSLVRVLDDAGVGDLLAIARAIVLVAMENSSDRLVINLSLTLDIPFTNLLETPPEDDLARFWFPMTLRNSAATSTYQNQIRAVLINIQRSLAVIFEYLKAKNVVVVAAAGNDALRLAAPPESCLPARYDSVLSVASVSRDTGRSGFSNKSAPTHGVAVFGGDGKLSGKPESVILDDDDPEESVDGVIGVMSAIDVPPVSSGPGTSIGSGTNASGWVYWAGTSFAAPVVSAIVANIKADDLTRQSGIKTIKEMIAQVQAYADPTLTVDYAGSVRAPVIFADNK